MKNLDMGALFRNMLVIMATVAGYVLLTNIRNPITRDIDIPGAFEVLVSPYGGWLNLLLLMVEFAGFTIVGYGLYKALRKDYNSTNIHWLWINLGLIVVGALLLAVIGLSWIQFPNWTDWLSLLPLAGLVAAGTLVVTARKDKSEPAFS